MSEPRRTEILRYAAFTDRPDGGNPAGLVLDSGGLDSADMQALAARIGYSESAFLTPVGAREGARIYDVRYFTPEVEVPFCGHATIAAAVALAERYGESVELERLRVAAFPAPAVLRGLEHVDSLPERKLECCAESRKRRWKAASTVLACAPLRPSSP